MLLALDVGNTQIFAGLFDKEGKILFRFRKSSKNKVTSDEYGVFLRSVLRENHYDFFQIEAIVISSVVPDLLYSIEAACVKYLNKRPVVLTPVSPGLNIKINVPNPQEVGSDRIATSMGAEFLFPKENKLIIDYGTATTFDVMNNKSEWCGGLIAPGFRTSMEALSSATAKLPLVEIKKPQNIVGITTVDNIQGGLYYGAVGMAREILNKITHEYFQGQPVRLIATGGFSSLFKAEQDLFEIIEPDLILMGLWQFYLTIRED